jgi:hypothetical protein
MESDSNEDYSPYCPDCGACGEDGCCSALFCKQTQTGHYCKGYLRDLQFGYAMHKEMWDLIPNDTETQKKLDEIYDKNYDIFYRNESK